MLHASFYATLLVMTLRPDCSAPGGSLDVHLAGRRVKTVVVSKTTKGESDYARFVNDTSRALLAQKACFRYVQTCRKTPDGVAWRRCYALNADGSAGGYFNYGAQKWSTFPELPRELCYFACEKYDEVVATAPVAELTLTSSWGLLTCRAEGRNIAAGRLYWTVDGERLTSDARPERDAGGVERLESRLYADPSADRYSCTLEAEGLLWRETIESYGPQYGVAAALLGAVFALFLVVLMFALESLRRCVKRRLRFARRPLKTLDI